MKNKTLDKLKIKRAKYAAGGYSYTDGSRNRSDSVETNPNEDTVDIGASQATKSLDGNTYATPELAEEANVRYRERLAAQTNPIETYQLGDADAPVQADLKRPTMNADNLLKMSAAQTDPSTSGTITTDIKKLTNATKAVGYGVGYGSQETTDAEVFKAETAVAPPRLSQYKSVILKGLKVEGADKQALENYITQVSKTGITRDNPFPAGLEKYRGQVIDRIMQAGQFKNFDAPIKGDFDGQAEGYDAKTAGSLTDLEAAKATTLTKSGYGYQSGDTTVTTAERDDAKEGEAKGTAAQRDPTLIDKTYATGATLDEDEGPITIQDVSGPDVTERTLETITDAEMKELQNLAKERGVNVEELDEYKVIGERKESLGIAAEKGYTPRLGEAPEATIIRAEYFGADYTPQGGNTDIEAVPAYEKIIAREAQTGDAAERIATELGDVPSIDLEGREAITGTAPIGNAAQIGGIPTMAAATMQAVKGEDRKVAAQDMMEVIADIQPEITAAIAEDPASYRVQQDTNPDPVVNAAIAALPEEALVSTQMENLLAGMESGKTPLWAKPAVDAMNQQMAARGLSVSTVGRDALFNAIIQSALPMAQSNAQALQQRAQQNLSNEQQANLASAQNTMQIRMQNLANRQTHASQTAEMSQQIKIQQGTFNQQAVMTSAEQRQQTELTNAQMAQQRAQQESSQRQQSAIAQLSTNAQMDLANLQAESSRAGKQMDADQQAKLSTYNAQIAKIMRQAELTQDMEKANLPVSLQIEMQRVSEMNIASKDRMTAENQERQIQLQTFIDFRKTDAQFAQQMDMANMSNEQQMELAMLQDKIATDSANFTTDNQFELTRLNNIVARSVRKAELDSRMEEVNLDAKLKIELSELSEKNTTERTNMTSEQQARLAELNVYVDFRKTDAAMAQQMDVANLANEQQMELANLQDRSAVDSANFTENNRFRLQELNTHVQVMSQNEQLKQNSDMAKLSMEEKIRLANLTEENRANSESMSADNMAELQVYEKKMQAAQINAQLAQQMELSELSNEQAAGMFNAQINANLDMKQFDANQQMQIANSQFIQTMTATKFSADQQSAMQNAVMASQVDLANADSRTRVSVENARNFLTMDMANLNNEQQGKVLDNQLEQQRLLSDQAAKNASLQFGATSQNQLDQFLIGQANAMNQYNSTANNAMAQFNTSEENKMKAVNSGNELQANIVSAQMKSDASKFNATVDNQRDTWNAANAQAVEQSNVQWRRSANTANTAAQNAANQINVQNAYNLTALDQAQIWQQLRDEATYVRSAYENDEQRQAQLWATALGNEALTEGTKFSTTTAAAIKALTDETDDEDKDRGGGK